VSVLGNLAVLILLFGIASPIIRAIAKRVFKSDDILRYALFPGVFLNSWTKSAASWLLDIQPKTDAPRWKTNLLVVSPVMNIVPLFILFSFREYIEGLLSAFSFPGYLIWFWLVSSIIIYGLPTIIELLIPIKNSMSNGLVISIIWALVWSIPIVQVMGIYSIIIFVSYAGLVFLAFRYNSKLKELYSPTSVMDQYLLEI
jgi:hypothetical protein